MVKLLSLDTSTTTTGYCLYKNARYHQSGILQPNNSNADLKNMCIMLWYLLTEINPDIIVIETPSVTKNAHTQRMLVIVFAVAYIWHILQDKDIFFYPIRPTEWRKHCSDDEWREKIKKKKRPQLKQLAVEEVKKLFPSVQLHSDDEAEAILIGLAYIHIFDRKEK